MMPDPSPEIKIDSALARWVVGSLIILMAAYFAGSLVAASREITVELSKENQRAFPAE